MSPELNRRIVEAANEAEAAFWKAVAKLFPEATTGDFDPLAYMRFDIACQNAIAHWVDSNVPKPHNRGCRCGDCRFGPVEDV